MGQTEANAMKLRWIKEGGKMVCRYNGHEATVTIVDGPLGPYASLHLDGKSKGGCGDGDSKGLTERAQSICARYLTDPHLI